MKIVLKTTKGEQFQVEVEESSTILNIKEKILALKQIQIEDQKLVHKGKMCADEKTVQECNIKDGDAIVITQTQKKAPLTSNIQPAQSVSNNTTNNNPVVQPIQQQPQQQQQQDPEYLGKVEQLVGMGFAKEKVERALQAAYQNADRAIEYLLNDNIPAGNLGNQPGSDQEYSDELEMDDQPFDGQMPPEITQIMNDPMFVQLRNTIRQNPALLQPILTQIQNTSPDMFNLIQAFPNILTGNPNQQEQGQGQQQPNFYQQPNPNQVQIHITAEDKAALDRLQVLGFNKQDCLEAYLACGKDENTAINYLLEEQEKGDLLSQHIIKEQQNVQQQQQQPPQQQQQQQQPPNQQQQPPQNPNNQGGSGNNNNNNNNNNQGSGNNGGSGSNNDNDDNIFD